MTQFLVILKEPKTYLVIKEDELRKIEEERNIQMLERINSLKIHA